LTLYKKNRLHYLSAFLFTQKLKMCNGVRKTSHAAADGKEKEYEIFLFSYFISSQVCCCMRMHRAVSLRRCTVIWATNHYIRIVRIWMLNVSTDFDVLEVNLTFAIYVFIVYCICILSQLLAR